MSYTYQFRLSVVKLVLEQDFGIREAAQHHHISHSLVINWLKAFRERGLNGVKSPNITPRQSKTVKPKMKKKDIEVAEPTDLSPQAFKKLQREPACLRAKVAYLKKLEEPDRQAKKRKIIRELKSEYALNDLLNAAEMSRSTFYYQAMKRDYRDEKAALLSLYQDSRQRAGYRPLTVKLRQIGFHLNHKTVLKLMNELGIHSIVRKKRHGKRGKTAYLAPNVLNRDFTAGRLNQKWVTDVTEFRVGQQKLYLSALVDLANWEIIAHQFAARPTFSMVKGMLEQGLS